MTGDATAYLRTVRSGGQAIEHVRDVACGSCAGRTMQVWMDEDARCALAACVVCHTSQPLADTVDRLEGADLGVCTCDCGGTTFRTVLGFTEKGSGELGRVVVGLHCLTDAYFGIYADWAIDATPSRHLLEPSPHVFGDAPMA